MAVAAAAAVWLPALHLFFGADPRSLGDALAARQLALWRDDAGGRARELGVLRAENPEWDFMARNLVAWSLANRALADPATKPRALEAIDAIVDDTLREEREGGPRRFLLPYAARGPLPRSLFVDGEIALTLGLRRLVQDDARDRARMQERVGAIVGEMSAAPLLSAESYPDQCWTFDQANALAAVRLADVLDGTDHSAFLARWVATAKARLVDPRTGLLVSSFHLDGTPEDGPEGSSIWMAASSLSIVDPAFARDQFERARRELGGGALGFGWSREWPASWRGDLDVDSGLPLPVVDASPSASGLELVADATFGDADRLRALLASLELMGFPVRDRDGLRFAAGNGVGDAVALYALSVGPAWKEVASR